MGLTHTSLFWVISEYYGMLNININAGMFLDKQRRTMKLSKTKKMLQEYVDRNRKEQRGTPITDVDIREVKQELTKFERMYKFYMISTILLFVTLSVMLFKL